MGCVTVRIVITLCWLFADFGGNVAMGAIVVPTCTSDNSVVATGVCYALAHTQNKSIWYASMELCGDLGWRMAIVNSSDINNLLVNGQIFSGSLGSDEYWISAYKGNWSGAPYKWHPDAALMSDSWTNWKAGEPDEQNNAAYWCVYAKHSEQHKWWDGYCKQQYLVLCEKDSACSSIPCQNGGTCTHSGGTYFCDCAVPFSGTNCEIGYQGNFTLVTGSYTFSEARNLCQATEGCTMCDLADVDTDEELTRVTQLFSTFHELHQAWVGLLRVGEDNGGVWSWKYWSWVRHSNVVQDKYSGTIAISGNNIEKCGRMTSTNVADSLGTDCGCGMKFDGYICEGDFSDKCDPNPCHPESVCSQVNHAVICECPSASADCQTVNPCSTSPCLYNGTCMWIGGTDYLCECAQYFSGDNCQINIINAEADTTPVITTEVDTTPVINTEVDTTPVITTEVDTTPVITAESDTTPFITAESDTTPVITTEVDTTPVITTEVDTTPVITAESDTTPVITAESDTTPVITTEVDTTPVITTTQAADTTSFKQAEMTQQQDTTATEQITTTQNPTTTLQEATSLHENTTTTQQTTVISTEKTTGAETPTTIESTTIESTTIESTTIESTTTVVESTTMLSMVTTVLPQITPADETTPLTTKPAPSLRCSTPKKLPNSYIESIPLVGGYAMYQCKTGYKFVDGSKTRALICGMNEHNVAVWHAEITDCQAKQCPPLDPPLENAICKTDQMPSCVQMTCHCPSGMLFANGQSRVVLQCGEREVWSKHPGSCLVRCGELPMIRNSRLIYSENYNNLPDSYIEVECDIGHRFPHGERRKQIICQHNGQWLDINYCHLDSCPTITSLNHASVNTTIAIYSTYVKVTCDDGYTITLGQWSKVVRCEVFGVWSQEINNNCGAIECPTIPNVHNADVIGSQRQYNSTVTYTCHSSYDLGGDILRQETGQTTSQIRCQQDSNWSVSALSCKDGRCAPVPDVAFAVPDNDQALQGSLVTYTCQTGYKTQTILCDNTQWNISHLQCEPVRCEHIDSIGNATVPLHLSNYLSTVEVTCHPGFTISQNSGHTSMLVQCTDSKSWKVIEVGNGTYWEESNEEMLLPSHCSVVRCGSLLGVHNSITPVFYPYEFNSNISITCKPGFWFSNGVYSQNIICGEKGNWEPVLEACIPTACPPQPSWQGVQLNTSRTAVGTAVNVTCSLNTVKRQQLFADDTSWHETVCAPNGEWLPSVPQCLEISNLRALVSETTEAKDAYKMGAIIITMLSLPYIVIILSDVIASRSFILFFLRNLPDGWLNFKDLIREPDTGKHVL